MRLIKLWIWLNESTAEGEQRIETASLPLLTRCCLCCPILSFATWKEDEGLDKRQTERKRGLAFILLFWFVSERRGLKLHTKNKNDKNDTESAVNICVYVRADWAEHSSYVRFGFSLRCVVMEMFSPSPVDACVFIRLISLAELAAFEADTQTGERKVKDSNRTRNEWKGEELNPKKGEVDSLQLKFSFTLLGMKVKMMLISCFGKFSAGLTMARQQSGYYHQCGEV